MTPKLDTVDYAIWVGTCKVPFEKQDIVVFCTVTDLPPGYEIPQDKDQDDFREVALLLRIGDRQ